MPTPKDLARVITRNKEQARKDEEVELAINAHLAFDKECEHHCIDCCWALHDQNQK